MLNDATLIMQLRQGEESAFETLIQEYHAPLMRLGMIYLNDARLVEEAIQDTWIGVLRGLERFEGRSSLKTWIFSILINRAKTYAQREGRYVQLELGDDDDPDTANLFYPSDHVAADEWITHPSSWDEIPEDRLVSQETLAYIQQAIAALPQNQREVITLRDVEHWNSDEVCNVLEISETNQRVLLHRARAKVRQRLENYLNG